MKKVLFIDDHEVLRNAYQQALENSTYESRAASDGETGIQLALTYQPDLIFLDLLLPGMDGIATMKALREQGIESIIYIISAFLPEYLERLSDAAKEGLIFGICAKPVFGPQLLQILDSNLNPDCN
jgi:CheY-like chemotaxis protein